MKKIYPLEFVYFNKNNNELSSNWNKISIINCLFWTYIIFPFLNEYLLFVILFVTARNFTFYKFTLHFLHLIFVLPVQLLFLHRFLVPSTIEIWSRWSKCAEFTGTVNWCFGVDDPNLDGRLLFTDPTGLPDFISASAIRDLKEDTWDRLGLANRHQG